MSSFGLNDLYALTGIDLRIILLVLVPVFILQAVLFIVALVSILKKKVPTADKVIWLLVVLLVNIIGPIVYFAVGAGMLEQKAAQIEDREQGNQ